MKSLGDSSAGPPKRLARETRHQLAVAKEIRPQVTLRVPPEGHMHQPWEDVHTPPRRKAPPRREIPHTPPPGLHLLQDGNEALAHLRQGVFHLGRNLAKNLPVNQAVGLEFAQLPGQHALRHVGHAPAELAEANRPGKGKMMQDDRLPLPSDDRQGEFEITPIALAAYFLDPQGPDLVSLILYSVYVPDIQDSTFQNR